MNTATVETLTAEVRVLMVGNRQVTLSVYRQLDEAPLSDVEPFGRVRDGKESGTWIVGRARDTGVLVRSRVEPKPYAIEVYANELAGKVTFCMRSYERPPTGPRVVSFNRRRVQFAKEAVEYCGIRHGSGPGCDGWKTNGLDAQIQAVLDEEDARLAPHRAAEALPLIVLAGLR